jgi:hypothetical protein
VHRRVWVPALRKGSFPPPPDNATPFSAKNIPYPEVIDHEDLPIRTERHLPNSISSESENQSNLNKNALWKHCYFLSISGQGAFFFKLFITDCHPTHDQPHPPPLPLLLALCTPHSVMT